MFWTHVLIKCGLNFNATANYSTEELQDYLSNFNMLSVDSFCEYC